MEKFLREKRDEIIWALAEQDYNQSQIARMFNTTKVNINRVMKDKPSGWTPKWVKRNETL